MIATKQFAIDKWLVYEAYQVVKANAGSAGVDKQSIKDFEKDLTGNSIGSGTGCLREATFRRRSKQSPFLKRLVGKEF